jgi:hypothetical protein
MLVERISPLTGKESTRDIPITREDLFRFLQGQVLLQEVAPRATQIDLMFLMTGMNEDEAKTFCIGIVQNL